MSMLMLFKRYGVRVTTEAKNCQMLSSWILHLVTNLVNILVWNIFLFFLVRRAVMQEKQEWKRMEIKQESCIQKFGSHADYTLAWLCFFASLSQCRFHLFHQSNLLVISGMKIECRQSITQCVVRWHFFALSSFQLHCVITRWLRCPTRLPLPLYPSFFLLPRHSAPYIKMKNN